VALQVRLGAAVGAVQVLDGGFDQVGGGAQQAAELLARHAAALRVGEQALAQRVDAVVGQGEVLDDLLGGHPRHLEQQQRQQPGAVLAGGAVEQRGALALGQDGHGAHESRPGVVEGGQVEGGDVVLVLRRRALLDTAPDLDVVAGEAIAAREAGGVALQLERLAQVDDRGQAAALELGDVAVVQVEGHVGAEEDPRAGHAALRERQPAEVAGVEGAGERQEAV